MNQFIGLTLIFAALIPMVGTVYAVGQRYDTGSWALSAEKVRAFTASYLFGIFVAGAVVAFLGVNLAAVVGAVMAVGILMVLAASCAERSLRPA